MSSDLPPARRDATASVLLAVAAGGAAGASLRAVVGELAPTTTAFPWATFWINVTGTALLAVLPALSVVRRHRLLPPLLGTGVLGGFTTLSAWSQETHDLVVAGRPGLAVAYAAGTLAACLVAVAAVDRLVGERLVGDRAVRT